MAGKGATGKTMSERNIDEQEVSKFEKLAQRWWDTGSEFKPLHEINPLRVGYIAERTDLSGKRILDVGCGGGILTEALAARGGTVTGIDAAPGPIEVAKLHRLESELDIDYFNTTIEEFAATSPGSFDIITCLEMLEHVPDPGSVISTCRGLLKEDGHLFLSTINRNPKSYLFAIVGAEYILNLLPKGTHDYEKLIKPAELARWCREAGLQVQDFTGMTYNPVTRVYRLGQDIDVNYLAHTRPA
jgi:2-polyprenyl-6-hydroxyphenyl methylase/3-demethylubiquinone-9 3-methyltransferase